MIEDAPTRGVLRVSSGGAVLKEYRIDERRPPGNTIDSPGDAATTIHLSFDTVYSVFEVYLDGAPFQRGTYAAEQRSFDDGCGGTCRSSEARVPAE